MTGSFPYVVVCLSLSPQLMEETGADFTMTFRQLSEASDTQLHSRLISQVVHHTTRGTPTIYHYTNDITSFKNLLSIKHCSVMSMFMDCVLLCNPVPLSLHLVRPCGR